MNILNDLTVAQVESVMTVSQPKGRAVQIKNRPSWGLSFCAEGQITYIHNGKTFVSDRNHAVILPEGQTYTLHCDKSGTFPLINFKCAAPPCGTIMQIPIRSAESYIKDCEHLKNLFLFERNRLKIMSIFYNILYSLASFNVSGCNILIPAIKYIENNYRDPNLTNADLAKQCSVSEIYFRKLFTQTYSVSPKQFVIDVRINKAKQLLTDGLFKICAVSGKCGFSNPYHFSRVFRKKTGLTPTEYMKRNKVNKI